MTKSLGIHKKDHNQAGIVAGLQAIGCDVIDMSEVGRGFPDILVGIDRRSILIEIKNPETHGGVSKLQREFHENWRGDRTFVVYSLKEAISAIESVIGRRLVEWN